MNLLFLTVYSLKRTGTSCSELLFSCVAWPGDCTFLGACPLPCIRYWGFAKDTFAAAASFFATGEEGGGEWCPEMFPQLSKAQLEIVMAEL